MEEKRFRNAVSFIGFAKVNNAPEIEMYKNPTTGNITVLFCDDNRDVVKAVYCSHAAVDTFLAQTFDKLQVVESLNDAGEWMPIVTVNKMSENRSSVARIQF